ncbi:MAG: ribosome maturation factor RimM [Defluviitaleaceae bacterium]|nr:ribosome maturation factor RimM [Defluviitaleaceae bacterium]
MNDYFEIGKIVNTVGISGEIKIFPTTDDAKRFGLLDTISIMLDGKLVEKTIRSVRYHRNLVMMKLEGIDDVNAATALRGGVIIVPRAQALPLEENEYYMKDLLGISVFAEDGEKLGVLADVLFTGANDVYVVKNSDAKDLLIPAISKCVLGIDIEGKRMTVRLLEGLRE